MVNKGVMMTEEQFREFAAKWTDGESEDGKAPLRPCSLEFVHAGHGYKVTFGNQGFDANAFGEEYQDEDEGGSVSRLWAYCVSDDVWYYDAEIAFTGRLSRAAAELINDFRARDKFARLSDAVASVLSAVSADSYDGFKSAMAGFGADPKTGALWPTDCFGGFGLLFDFKATPIS